MLDPPTPHMLVGHAREAVESTHGMYCAHACEFAEFITVPLRLGSEQFPHDSSTGAGGSGQEMAHFWPNPVELGQIRNEFGPHGQHSGASVIVQNSNATHSPLARPMLSGSQYMSETRYRPQLDDERPSDDKYGWRSCARTAYMFGSRGELCQPEP